MRRLFPLVFVLFWLVAGSAYAAPLQVYLVNHSTVVSDAELVHMTAALQQQVSLDFAPVWNIDATLIVDKTPPDEAWQIEITDDATIYGALGYHDVCSQNGHGYPCGFVFAQTTLDDGGSVSVTLSHELLEILADPYTSTTVKVGSRFYLQEVCDSPESEAFAYERNGVLLSDFVTPYFFRLGHVGPYDFQNVIRRPLQILSQGYLSWWQNGVWHQDFKSVGRAA